MCDHRFFLTRRDAQDACCATCTATAGCTHWVFHPWEGDTGCHVKGGATADCGRTMNGSTAGILANPAPGPGPS